MPKILILIFFLFTLNGCATSGTALLGQIFTGAKTGSIYQASLSYSTNKLMDDFITNEIYNLSIINDVGLSNKSTRSLPDIPYTEKDPKILTSYKVDKIKFSEVSEPEPLP